MYYPTMETLDTFQSVIEAFGGPTKFADAIGITGIHAQSMKTRDSIPPAYWVETVSAAKRLAIETPDNKRLPLVTLEKLAELAKAKRAEAAPSEQVAS